MSHWSRSSDADGKAIHRAIKAFEVHLAKEKRESVKGVGGLCTTADFGCGRGGGGGDEGLGSGRDVRRGGPGLVGSCGSLRTYPLVRGFGRLFNASPRRTSCWATSAANSNFVGRVSGLV